MKNKKLLTIIIIICCIILIFPFIFVSLSKTHREETIKLTYDNAQTVSNIPNTPHTYETHKNNFSFGTGAQYNTADDMAIMEEFAVEDNAIYEIEGDSNISSNASDSVLLENKKIKKTYNYKLETTEYDTYITNLEQNIQENDGFIDSVDEDTKTQNNSTFTETYKVRQSIYNIKIPADKADKFVAELDGNAEIIYKNNIVDDVTTQYIDLDTHIAALEKEYNTLQDLLKQATNVSEIIEVRDRLTAIEYQLESYNQQFDALKDDIAYSTLNLTINEVIYYTDTVARFSSDIAESWAYIFEDWLIDVIPTAFFILITLIPFIILICIVIIILVNKIYKIKQKHKQILYIQQEDSKEHNE